MNMTDIGVIILAAGKGTRMKSELPKVLHQINGKSMISLVVECASALFGHNIVVVVGHKAELVKNEINHHQFKVSYALQKELLGTGDAVRSAIPFLNKNIKHVLVLCGDVPLIQQETLKKFVAYHMNNSNEISVLAVIVDTPAGYGRIIFNENDKFASICEDADATDGQKKINMINSGIYCIEKEFLIDALDLINVNNMQKEYYLTDLVSISFKNKGKTGCFVGSNPEEVMGVNNTDELKIAENLFLKNVNAKIN